MLDFTEWEVFLFSQLYSISLFKGFILIKFLVSNTRIGTKYWKESESPKLGSDLSPLIQHHHVLCIAVWVKWHMGRWFSNCAGHISLSSQPELDQNWVIKFFGREFKCFYFGQRKPKCFFKHSRAKLALLVFKFSFRFVSLATSFCAPTRLNFPFWHSPEKKISILVLVINDFTVIILCLFTIS